MAPVERRAIYRFPETAKGGTPPQGLWTDHRRKYQASTSRCHTRAYARAGTGWGVGTGRSSDCACHGGGVAAGAGGGPAGGGDELRHRLRGEVEERKEEAEAPTGPRLPRDARRRALHHLLHDDRPGWITNAPPQTPCRSARSSADSARLQHLRSWRQQRAFIATFGPTPTQLQPLAHSGRTGPFISHQDAPAAIAAFSVRRRRRVTRLAHLRPVCDVQLLTRNASGSRERAPARSRA
jgi:hypothetical protein